MRLNHLDLQVQDVQRNVAYFTRYFGLEPRSNPNSPAIAIMSDGHGFVLVLQRAEAPMESYPAGFHVGFLVDDPETVRSLHARALADGAQVSEVIVNGRGTHVYFAAPDGYRIEVSCQRVRFA
jgi:catechol 2,3-dioxygenase-like lactoylglutathione lyase family enzyme